MKYITRKLKTVYYPVSSGIHSNIVKNQGISNVEFDDWFGRGFWTDLVKLEPNNVVLSINGNFLLYDVLPDYYKSPDMIQHIISKNQVVGVMIDDRCFIMQGAKYKLVS